MAALRFRPGGEVLARGGALGQAREDEIVNRAAGGERHGGLDAVIGEAGTGTDAQWPRGHQSSTETAGSPLAARLLRSALQAVQTRLRAEIGRASCRARVCQDV